MIKQNLKTISTSFLLALLLFSCKNEEPATNPIVTDKTPIDTIKLVPTPSFNSDSAYYFIEKQVAFGPRVPNSDAHKACAKWLVSKLKSYNFEVIEQKGEVQAFTGDILQINNIMAQHNPSAKSRILLCAHWDSRPFADKDKIDPLKPIDGANDGASGVGVILEIARQISMLSPGYGVDIVFFDAEDYGSLDPTNYPDVKQMQDDWCLGSQYWAINLPIPNYTANYGILLDMVGAKDATFPKEGISMMYAKTKVNKMWTFAKNKGYGDMFVHNLAGQITDDHVYVNKYAGIPTLDIIDMRANDDGFYFNFGSFHHTHGDNLGVIDKNTLQKVGEVVMEAIYQRF